MSDTVVHLAWLVGFLILWLVAGCFTEARHAMWVDPNGHERIFMYPYQQPDYK